jgi:hypothetical protein
MRLLFFSIWCQLHPPQSSGAAHAATRVSFRLVSQDATAFRGAPSPSWSHRAHLCSRAALPVSPPFASFESFRCSCRRVPGARPMAAADRRRFLCTFPSKSCRPVGDNTHQNLLTSPSPPRFLTLFHHHMGQVSDGRQCPAKCIPASPSPPLFSILSHHHMGHVSETPARPHRPLSSNTLSPHVLLPSKRPLFSNLPSSFSRAVGFLDRPPSCRC